MKKRLLALMIALCCMLSFSSYAAENPTHTYILSLLEQGEYDMAIHVIEGLKMYGSGNAPVESAPAAEQPNEIVHQLEPDCNGTDWMFNIHLENRSNEVLVLQCLQIHDYINGNPFGMHEFEGPDLARLGLEGFTLHPNEGLGWSDAHPVVSDFNQRDYVFFFHNEQGSETILVYSYNLDNSAAPMQQAPAADWHFPILLQNDGNTPIQLVSMDITDLMDGQPLGTSIFEGEDSLAPIGLGNLILEPGQHMNWNDGHPATNQFNGREYRFHFRDTNGETQVQTFRFENLDEVPEPVDYASDSGKDLSTLRYGADFENEVFPGVYWVPANMLGGSGFTNAEMHNLLPAPPEEKQAAVHTLYEALQLYQIGYFSASDDNIRIHENGVNWEHHKPGYHAVRTNTGCCATDSNWLRYILDGDYEEVGFIATSQRDGSGHVYNYILQDGWYYFIDLTHYRNDGNPMDTAVEDGNLSSYYATDFILGNIHKTESIKAYVDYVQQTFNAAPGLMFMYTAENVLAVDGAPRGNSVHIIYEAAEGVPMQVIFDDPSDALEFVQEPSPRNLPDWDQLPSANFNQ